MKKLLARPSSKFLLVLALVLIALVATGCGGGSKKKKSPPPPPPPPQLGPLFGPENQPLLGPPNQTAAERRRRVAEQERLLRDQQVLEQEHKEALEAHQRVVEEHQRRLGEEARARQRVADDNRGFSEEEIKERTTERAKAKNPEGDVIQPFDEEIDPHRQELFNDVRPQEEDLHFRAFIPLLDGDQLTRPLGAVHRNKENFVLFDFHDRDSEFENDHNTLTNPFYIQRLRDQAIRFQEPMFKTPVEFRGDHNGIRPDSWKLTVAGNEGPAPSFKQYNKHQKEHHSLSGWVDLQRKAGKKRKMITNDSNYRFNAIRRGGENFDPLSGVMHDQMRENIDFGKDRFILDQPIAQSNGDNPFASTKMISGFDMAKFNTSKRMKYIRDPILEIEPPLNLTIIDDKRTGQWMAPN